MQKEEKITEKHCLEILQNLLSFMQNFDRVPGTQAYSWHQNMLGVVAVHNFLKERSGENPALAELVGEAEEVK